MSRQSRERESIPPPTSQIDPDSVCGLAQSGKLDEAFHFALANEQTFVPVDGERLRQIAESVLRDEQIAAADVSVALVDDATIHEINRRYLNHDDPTDVISFSLADEPSDPSDSGRCIDGEIVISGETALRVANEQSGAAAEEVALYLVHGLLHLCGYDDQTAEDRACMERRQQSHLQKFGIRPNY